MISKTRFVVTRTAWTVCIFLLGSCNESLFDSGTCTGRAWSCPTLYDPAICQKQQGCLLIGRDNLVLTLPDSHRQSEAFCQGMARLCTDIEDGDTCRNQYGCLWTD